MSARASYLDVTQQYVLRQACRAVHDAFGSPPYLVGSCLDRADYRDVDVRTILGGEAFDAMFPDYDPKRQNSPRLALLNAAISTFLAARTGLPIDFQIQRRTEANAAFGDRPRLALFVSEGRP